GQLELGPHEVAQEIGDGREALAGDRIEQPLGAVELAGLDREACRLELHPRHLGTERRVIRTARAIIEVGTGLAPGKLCGMRVTTDQIGLAAGESATLVQVAKPGLAAVEQTARSLDRIELVGAFVN